MLQKPNTVFVATGINTAGSTLAVGELVAINATTGAVIATAAITTLADAPSAIQLGYVKAIGATDADATIVKTQNIGRKNVKSIQYADDVAKAEATALIDFTGATITAGIRYVLRVVYKDIYEHPGQFTHTYEVIAATGESDTSIAVKFADRINAHTGRRVNANKSVAKKVTLTAMAVDSFGTAGKEAITPYSQVQMEVAAYKTNPAAAFSKKEGFLVVDTVVTPGKPGKGNPFIVRDREQAALAYKGITYRTEWPVIKPELNVDLSKTYDTLVIEYSNEYQSPDNQYVKSTDLAAEVYVVAGTALATLNGLISGWASLVGPQGEAGV